MNHFTLCIPTQVHFGSNALDYLQEGIRQYGSRVLLVYGNNSIHRSGLYQKITAILQSGSIPFVEMPGIVPNPCVELVERGVKICRENTCDLILAVGGGSVIDCAKAIAAAVFYDGNPWDLICKKASITKVLPLLSIPTMAGTGSEMSAVSVISNLATQEKIGLRHPDLRCKIAYMNPEFTCSLPLYQTCAGIADAFSHAMECYFSNIPSAFLQARLGESVMRTLVESALVLLKQPENYDARANVMWASSLAMNDLLSKGNEVSWSLHPMEHELSAYYNITHGVGLGVLIPAWMQWMLRPENTYRYIEYAKNVFQIKTESMTASDSAKAAIDKTKELMSMLKIPAHLKDLGVREESLSIMANRIGNERLQKAFVPLCPQSVLEFIKWPIRRPLTAL